MKAVPEDLRYALEQWAQIDSKLLQPLRGLGDVLRACANAYERHAQLEQQISALDQRLKGGQEQLDSQSAASETLRQAIHEQTTTKNALTQELAALQARLQAAKRTLDDLRQIKV